MTAERRQQVRYAVKFDVRFARAQDAARALQAFSVNFSSGGLCVRSASSFEPGDLVAVALTVEGEQFELAGVVAWARGGAIGVRFVNVPPEQRQRLERVAQSLAKRQPALS